MRPEPQGQKSKRDPRRASSALARVTAGILLGTAFATACAGEGVPTTAHKSADSRFTYVDYDESQVVNIVGHFGYLTHISFGPGETVTDVLSGDSEAWDIAPAGNHVFIKPKAENGRTNMTVITAKGRVYTFMLETAPKRPNAKGLGTDLDLRVVFRYPEDERKRAASQVDEDAIARKQLADAQREIRNINYLACGSDEVNPDQAFDDGRFTYLRYAGSREFPAVFTVDADGGERLVDSHTENDTIVVHRVAERFVFRRGKAVGCVVNKGFDPRGVETFNGTVDQDVVRIVKPATAVVTGGQP